VSKRKQTLISIALMAVGLVFLGSAVRDLAQLNLFGTQPAIAQLVSPNDVWRQVYQQLPNLPLENQYVSRETGKVDPNNTLVSRLVKYHMYVRRRPPNYRLDWKLTMADYLGANELMEDGIYPGSDTLKKNPIDADRAAIGRLNRAQRDALVEVLVSIFNENSSTTLAPTPDSSPQLSNAPSPATTTAPLPRPGDARLLLP
jgi:hypothetical protein